jgi:hypothetical protein
MPSLVEFSPIGRYKNTFRPLCHGKAQNVPQHGTEILLDLNDYRMNNAKNIP